MIIQITYALYLMHSNDFYYTDLHWENIMYKKTNIKSIKILNFNVSTFGYIWSIIDYSDIQSRRFKYRNAGVIYNFFGCRNLANEDIIRLIFELYSANDIIRDIIIKIIKNIKLSNIEIKEIKENYQDIKKFCKYAATADHMKIIKYFHSKINK